MGVGVGSRGGRGRREGREGPGQSTVGGVGV